ncbi:hypothetical protein Taro_002135, partial [Colocasia esculenta]|nr:hypothetical protein [Colocasia esculenta]
NTDHPLRNHAAIGNLMDKVDILDAPDKFGAVVLWCLSRRVQVLVNVLNSQAVCGVGRRAYLLGFFESSHSKRLESSCSRNIVNVIVELSSFGRPKEEKVEAPSPSAARGCYNNVVKTLP